MQPALISDTSEAFSSTAGVTLKTLVKQIEGTKIKALKPSEYEDVLTILDYLKAEALKAHKVNEARTRELDTREQDLAKRERDVAIRQRAVASVIGTPVKRRFWSWS